MTPYSKICVKVFNHNTLKRDGFIGDATISLYELLEKHNGQIANLNLSVALKLPSNSLKSLLANRGPNYVTISLDGLNVDMSKFAKESLPSSTSAQPNNNPQQPQPSTSASSTVANSVPKAINDIGAVLTAARDSLLHPSSSGLSSTSNSPTPSSNRPSAPTGTEEPLPDGWEIRYDQFGRYVL